VLFVERDVLRTIPTGENPAVAEDIPQDPLYPDQWGPACIGAEQAWDYEFLWGRPELIVAVIDTGIDLDHPDLIDSVDPSIDYDFVNGDEEAMDDNGHGTHCAGIIAAGSNNGIGITGLQNVTLMAVKGLDERGRGWDSVLAKCIVYATDNGAKVISNSWGSLGSSATLAQATYYAYTQGAVVVAAAGNFGIKWKHYPAAYPWVVGVAALANCTTRAPYSNYGAENVFISAPGSDIWSTYWDNTYESFSGTSMACPHVASVAVMWIGAYLDDVELTPRQVMILLATTAHDLGDPGKDIYYGWGRVNMFPWAD
jgi:subtilisin family serine protease